MRNGIQVWLDPSSSSSITAYAKTGWPPFPRLMIRHFHTLSKGRLHMCLHLFEGLGSSTGRPSQTLPWGMVLGGFLLQRTMPGQGIETKRALSFLLLLSWMSCILVAQSVSFTQSKNFVLYSQVALFWDLSNGDTIWVSGTANTMDCDLLEGETVTRALNKSPLGTFALLTASDKIIPFRNHPQEGPISWLDMKGFFLLKCVAKEVWECKASNWKSGATRPWQSCIFHV